MDNVTAFHYYAGSAQFIFNALFFNATGLREDVNHTLSWVLHATKTNGSTESALFDYAMITVDPSAVSASPSTVLPNQSSAAPPIAKSKSQTGPIVGGVVGGVALIGVTTTLVLLLRRRHREPTTATTGAEPRPRGARAHADHVLPFVESAPLGSEAGHTTGGGSESKILDVSWASPASSAAAPSLQYGAPPATTDLSSTPASHPSPSVFPTSSELSPTPAQSTTSMTAREQFLEERLALLEAQVSQHLPPPYLRPVSQ
ncbi:hypothetical protein B0H19DRAFT_81762 [Mycena capillaripes]|nr:hypothetical protein B0H19DRAFT_81762 [Mycena capillaripes]